MAFKPKRRVAVRVVGAPKGREKETAARAGGALKRIGQSLQAAAPAAMSSSSVPPMPPPGMSSGAGAPPLPGGAGFKRGGKVGKAKARKH